MDIEMRASRLLGCGYALIGGTAVIGLLLIMSLATILSVTGLVTIAVFGCAVQGVGIALVERGNFIARRELLVGNDRQIACGSCNCGWGVPLESGR